MWLKKKDYLDQSLTTKIITQVDEVSNELTNKKFMLFTTRTCPNCLCKIKALDQEQALPMIRFSPRMIELAKHYNISQVPTLVVVDHNKNVEQYANYGNIAKFIQRQA